MAEPSKITTDRAKIQRYTMHSINDHLLPQSERIAREIFGPSPPATFTMDELLANMANRTHTNIVRERDADMALTTDLIETDEARLARSVQSTTVVGDFRIFRDALQTTYGPEILRRYGMSSAVPTVDNRALAYIENSLKQLRQRPITETPRIGLSPIDPAPYIERFEAGCALLDQYISDADREDREDHTARARRDKLREEGWRTYKGISKITEGFCEIIGEDELARRVRLTSKRRAGIPEPLDEIFDETGEEPELDAFEPEPA